MASCSSDAINSHDLPVLRITANEADLFSDSLGIYVNGIGRGENWQGQKANYFEGRKIQATFEYFVNGNSKINQQVDIKVSGGGSRKWPQKSLNIYAEKKYGSKYFKYPFFSNLSIDKFNTVRLRNSGQDWDRTHFRDGLMHVLTNDMSVYNQAYQPVVVYINNRYWGILNLREKFNKTYIRNHCNLDRDVEIDILEKHLTVDEGSSDKYEELIGFLKNNDLSINKNYSIVSNQIDLENFIDYNCAQIYFANTDWPWNNSKYWRPKTEKGKWKWFMHDTDLGFGRAPLYGHPGGVEHNSIEYALNDDENTTLKNAPVSTLILRKLLENDVFRIQFKSRFNELLKKDFSTQKVLRVIDSLQLEIASEMPNHIERWRSESDEIYQSMVEWNSNVEELRSFARKRPQFLKKYLDQAIPD